MHQIYISSTTGGTPQDAYEQNDPLIESPVHPLAEVHQPSPANIHTYTYNTCTFKLNTNLHIYRYISSFQNI